VIISITDDQPAGILRSVPRAHSTADATAHAPASPVLGARLGYLLKRAYAGYLAIQAPALAPFGIDGRLLAVLSVIEAEGPSLQRRLVERLNVDRTTMVAIIDRLEQGGLLTRESDPQDRRAHLVSITRDGERIRREAQAAADEAEKRFLDGLSAPERRQLRRLLQAVVDGQLS
jgi:DNA-binding MarR family transcriptional regulator